MTEARKQWFEDVQTKKKYLSQIYYFVLLLWSRDTCSTEELTFYSRLLSNAQVVKVGFLTLTFSIRLGITDGNLNNNNKKYLCIYASILWLLLKSLTNVWRHAAYIKDVLSSTDGEQCPYMLAPWIYFTSFKTRFRFKAEFTVAESKFEWLNSFLVILHIANAL